MGNTKEYNQEYYQKNIIELKEKRKKRYQSNRELALEFYKKYRMDNLEKERTRVKKYYEKNKVTIYKRNRKNIISRYKNDVLFKLSTCVRSSISKSITRSGFRKTTKTEIILGCSFVEFKQYLESMFEDWMNWDNHGLYNNSPNYGWDIDHIIPISNAKSEYEIIKLNHYSNLQPLCSYLNRCVKRDTLNEYH